MKEQSITHHTFTMERHYPVPPAKVFDAFSNSEKKKRWFGEGRTHDLERFEMDFREGGREIVFYRFGDKTPFPGVELTNDSVFQNIVPDSRIMMASVMTMGGRCISTSLMTFEFLEANGGADLIFTHHGAFLEGSGGPEMREIGWQTLFEQLKEEIARS
jgi:uncharacterized protein YndB with AHSA1/START domain